MRFTPAQRDALIDLAARLQAEHEATVDAQELARAAAEAGIDPRFLHEAAIRMQAQPAPAPRTSAETDRRTAVAALVTLAIVDTLFFLIRPRGYVLPREYGMLIALASLCASALIARFRPMRFLAPVGAAAIWMAIGISTIFVEKLVRGYVDYDVPRFIVLSGVVQLVISAIVAGIAAAVDRTPYRQ